MNRPILLALISLALVSISLTTISCGGDSATPQSWDRPISLVERWPGVRIEAAMPAPSVPPAAEIRFDGAGLTGVSWKVANDIEDARVEDGRLVGRSTGTSPALLIETAAPLGGGDALWSVKIRLRASAGSRIAVQPVRQTGPPIPAVLGRIDQWPLSSPLVAGDEIQTYSVVVDRVFTLEMPIAERDVSQILVRPTNIEGADFAIESVQLVFRQEYLASIASGPGWHGLSEVFRESLVSRAPESLRFDLTLPARPWLDLSVGAVQMAAPHFRVEVAPAGGGVETVAELEVEAPEQWREARIDLARWAGQKVELRLTAQAEEAGSLAFWGAPTIRDSVDRQTAAGSSPPQAVIIFLADTLRSDHLGAWGHDRETAPTLTRLASEGVRFDDAVAQATWTKASVSSILTSLYPSTTGVVDLNDRVHASETTLAEAFRHAGYATFATSSVPFTGQLTNLHQGVEVLHEFGAVPDGGGEYRSKTSQHWVDTFLAWLENHHDVPIFALVHVMDPHSPFRPATPYDTMWSEAGAGERFAAHADKVRPLIKNPLFRNFMAPSREELSAAGVDEEEFLRIEKDWYDGSIRGMDAQLQRLISGLGELGGNDGNDGKNGKNGTDSLAERSLVAFVTDHGEEFLEHGHHWHGMTPYGEVANVPLVFWGMGVPDQRVVEETVQNIDIMPTLLELAGIPIPERAQGRSLVPLFEADGARTQPAFTDSRGRGPEGFDRFSIVEDGWKLVWNRDAAGKAPEHELYNHKSDPLNLTDVASDHPEIVDRLAPAVRRWQTFAEAQKLDEATVDMEVSAEELERLRSLGYVE